MQLVATPGHALQTQPCHPLRIAFDRIDQGDRDGGAVGEAGRAAVRAGDREVVGGLSGEGEIGGRGEVARRVNRESPV